MYLDTLLAHAFKETVTHTPAAHIVIGDTHLDTLAGFVNQCVSHQISQWVILNDIHVDMDVVCGSTDILQQFREEGIAIGHDVYLVVLEGQRHVLVDEQVYQLFVVVGNPQVLLFHKAQHGTFCQLVEFALVDQSLTSVVDAEEQIEHDAYQGQEHDDECPCHRLGWLAVVHDHMNHGHCHQCPKQRHAYHVKQSFHPFSNFFNF